MRLTAELQEPSLPENSCTPMMANTRYSNMPKTTTPATEGIERIRASSTTCMPCRRSQESFSGSQWLIMQWVCQRLRLQTLSAHLTPSDRSGQGWPLQPALATGGYNTALAL